tara:strand:+ start:1208 stop:1846 length:639 start_codon:yes stop_codon:yes gene_type:complete
MKQTSDIVIPNLYDFMIIQQDVIPSEDIADLMMVTNEKPTGQATIKNGDYDEETLKHIRNTLWYDIPDELHVKLQDAVSNCYKRFVGPKYNCEFKSYEPVQFLSYPPGGHYREHIDTESYNYQTRKWETLDMPTGVRDISFLFYLNEEFGGGEIEFPRMGLTIKPKTGMMIAFPSYKEFPHKVHPVTWGTRHTLVCWVGTQKKLYETAPFLQ